VDFYKDSTVYEAHLRNLLPMDDKVQKQFQKDLQWFQEEYRKGKNSKYYAIASRDNTQIINAFRDYLKWKGFSPLDWVRDIYAQISNEKIIRKLNEIYLGVL
jgi:hypothetical protein